MVATRGGGRRERRAETKNSFKLWRNRRSYFGAREGLGWRRGGGGGPSPLQTITQGPGRRNNRSTRIILISAGCCWSADDHAGNLIKNSFHWLDTHTHTHAHVAPKSGSCGRDSPRRRRGERKIIRPKTTYRCFHRSTSFCQFKCQEEFVIFRMECFSCPNSHQ